MNNPNQIDKNLIEEAPPIFKTWPRFYFVVSANLVLLLLLFYTFTRIFE